MFRARLLGWWLVLITLLAYLPTLQNGFVNFDDQQYVTRNPMVLPGLTWKGIWWAFGTGYASNWHPLTWLSHMLDCEVFRLNPAGHHLVNLLFHAANAGLLFMLWRRLLGSVWPAAVTAALFAWHPLHVESVAWVAERKDVLSTFFALLALLRYVRWAGAPCRRVGSGDYWLVLVFFACGLMAKPMVVTLPLVMLLLDYWPLGRFANGGAVGGGVADGQCWPELRRLVVEKWPFWVLSVAAGIVTVLAQRADALAPLTKYSMGLRIENMATAYALYLGKTFWPVHLAVFYPLMPPGVGEVTLAGAVLLAISVLAVWRMKAQPYLLFGWLWYLGTLAPVVGLLQVGDQAMADRYTYMPLIGLFIGAVLGLRDLARQFGWLERSLPAIATVVLVACLAGMEHQLRCWRNGETLFAHALAVTPNNATARLNLGEALQEEGKREEALAEYQRAVQLDPARFEAYNNIGRLLSDAGKPTEALEYCRTAVSLNPGLSASHIGLGVVWAELGRYEEALSEFTQAGRLDDRSAAPPFQGGRVLLKLGRGADARRQFEEALRREPNNMGMLIYVARALAAAPDPAVRDGAEALVLARRAAELAGPRQPVVLDTLAMACAEAGRFDQAATFGRQAVAAAQAGGAWEDAAEMQQRLDQYEQHQPARHAPESAEFESTGRGAGVYHR